MENSTNEVKAVCKRLRLGKEFLDELSSKKGRDLEAILEILQREAARRCDRLAVSRIKEARFPQVKTYEGYKFDAIEFPTTVARDFFTTCKFVDTRHNIFMYGPPGTGKTHLATAIGISACMQLKRVKFHRLSELITRLRYSTEQERTKLTHGTRQNDLTIIDEFGYLPDTDDAIPLLFEFISCAVYERHSLVMTSNIEFTEWLANAKTHERMAHALVDRVIHNSFLFNFRGKSHRVANSPMLAQIR